MYSWRGIVSQDHICHVRVLPDHFNKGFCPQKLTGNMYLVIELVFLIGFTSGLLCLILIQIYLVYLYWCTEGHFIRLQHELYEKQKLLKMRQEAVRLLAPQASPKACIKHVCVSVVWTFRQLPRCHHTGQRWPIPQEEGGDQGHGWPEEGSAHCEWSSPFWTLLNVVIVATTSSSLNNDSFDSLSSLELYLHFNEHILYW